MLDFNNYSMIKYLIMFFAILCMKTVYCQNEKFKYSVDTSFNAYVNSINSQVGNRAYNHVFIVIVNEPRDLCLSYNVVLQTKEIEFIKPTHIGKIAGHFVLFRNNLDSNINQLFNLKPYYPAESTKEVQLLKKNDNVIFDGEFLSRIICFKLDSIIEDKYIYQSEILDSLWIYDTGRKK